MKNISIWISAGLFCLIYGFSGLYLLTQRPEVSSLRNSESAWYILDSADVPFTAAFPKQPTRESETLKAGSISFPIILYTSELSFDEVFMVTYCTYPDSVDTSNPKSNLEGSVQGSLKNIPQAELVAETFGTFQDFSCVDYTMISKEGISLKGKNILVGKTLVSLAVSCKSINDENYSKFTNSFKLR